MDKFEDIKRFYDIKDLLEAYDEANKLDEEVRKKIEIGIDESLQYHHYLLGELSGYPDIFKQEYLRIIVEYKEKKSVQAVIKGYLTHTIYFFPQSLDSKAFCMDLYQRGTSASYIIITEAIKTIDLDIIHNELKKHLSNERAHICDISTTQFKLKEEKPQIIPLGKTKLNSHCEGIKRFIGVCNTFCKGDDLFGTNRLEIFNLGLNVDQYFYIHMDPYGNNTLYKYNLLEGWTCEIDRWASAREDSKGETLTNYLLAKFTEPQYSFEFEIKPIPMGPQIRDAE